MGDTCTGSSFPEHLTPFRAETQRCGRCPIDPSLPSAAPLRSPHRCAAAERGRPEEIFSFPHPPTVILCSCKVITFLIQAGLRGMEPSMPRRKKVTLAVACGAIPRQTVCPEAPVPSFPFPFESLEACASQTDQADDWLMKGGSAGCHQPYFI